MSKGGIKLNSFGFQPPKMPGLMDPKHPAEIFKKFVHPLPTPGTPPAATKPGAAVDALLSQALSAKHSAVKASLISAYVTRNYLEAHVPTCRLPDVEPKPGVEPKPVVEPKPGPVDGQPPAAAERTLTGDELVRHLDAGGAAISEKNGAYGVKSGRDRELTSEIDPGETLTFHAPGGRAEGGRVTIDKLYNDGPDPNRQEQGTIEVYDGDRLVKTIDIRGYSDSNGRQSVEIDVPFTKLVFKANGEFKGGGNHSDFAIRDVTVRQPEGNLHILPHPNEPDVRAPVLPPDVILNPVPTPIGLKDSVVGSVSRSLGRLADVIDRSKLPEAAQNALLDRIATLLGELRQPRDSAGQWATALSGVASLLQILDRHVPHHVAVKTGGGAEQVSEHLKTLLFHVALGREDALDPSKAA